MTFVTLSQHRQAMKRLRFKRKKIANIYDKKTNRRLEVWQNVYSLFAKLSTIGTKECISTSSFNQEDGNISVDRICEYYNFPHT